jgi:hypothetical protein
MKQIFQILAVVLSACFCLFEGDVQAQTASDIVEKADPSVGRVFSERDRGMSSGTGFVISSISGSRDIHFVTNYHVIQGTRGLKIGFSHNDESYFFEATVVDFSVDLDLAVLRVRIGNDGNFVPRPLKIALRDIKKGEVAHAVGFPGVSDDFDLEGKNILESTFSSGAVSRVVTGPFRPNGRPLEIVQHTTAINQGNSGGPLLDNCANVIGVNTLGLAKDNIYLASSSNTLGLYLGTLDVKYGAVRSDCNGLAAKPSGTDVDSVERDADEKENEAEETSAFAKQVQKWLIPGAIILGTTLLFGVIFAIANRSNSTEKPSPKPRESQAKGTALTLTATSPDGSQQTFKATRSMLKSGFTIGRPGESSFGLNAGKVSRKHLRIYQDDRRLMAMDLGSTNGTKVNGKPLSTKVAAQINSSSVIDVAGILIVLKT